MKKAYLITAYHQAAYLENLIDSLDHADCNFYVHIDAKSNIQLFRKNLNKKTNVKLVKSRKINWMGFSQVQSILSLMRAAVEDGFDYASLISGSDYPIKSNKTILDFFAQANEEYLVFWKLKDRPSWMHKVQHYYPMDLVPIKGYETAGFRRYFWGYFYKLASRLPKRKPPKFELYGGSDWWSLSYKCIRYILDYVDANPAYVRFYRYTHCPSEMFFHSIVLNSKFASKVKNFNLYQEWSKKNRLQETSMIPEHTFNLRYIDWSGGENGDREGPAVLDERDWVALTQSDDLFARKFEEAISDKLIEQIESQLR